MILGTVALVVLMTIMIALKRKNKKPKEEINKEK